MRCLAVRQPWAWALVAGAKDIENRTWGTDYRGPVIIQASSSKTVVNQFSRIGDTELPTMPFAFSALIGVVDLVDVVALHESLESNRWASGPFCWRIANARMFKEPIAAKGKLNLYKLPADPEDRVRTGVSTATPAELNSHSRAWIEVMTRIDDVVDREERFFDTYLDLGDSTSARRLAERAIRERSSAGAYLLRAAVAYEDGDLTAALADTNMASELDGADERIVALRKTILDKLAATVEAN